MTDPTAPLVPEAPPSVLAVLTFLRTADQLVARLGGDVDRVTPRKPADISSSPWLLVRPAGGFSLDIERGAWSRLVQLEACAVDGATGDELPEFATDRIAGLAAALVVGAGARTYAGASWRARHLDGPNDLTDTTRGEDSPVYRSVIRLDVRMHAPT